MKSAPKYDKVKFEKAFAFALTQTANHNTFFSFVRDEFQKSGVFFEVLPNISGSKINGATKKIGDHILLMVNDRGASADTFWFSLFHEIGHIMNNDFGISFDKESGDQEVVANHFAEDALIPRDLYESFVADTERITPTSVIDFSSRINRDPGIVVGRLQRDRHISYDDWRFFDFKQPLRVCISSED